jgi:hypothetical protein
MLTRTTEFRCIQAGQDFVMRWAIFTHGSSGRRREEFVMLTRTTALHGIQAGQDFVMRWAIFTHGSSGRRREEFVMLTRTTALHYSGRTPCSVLSNLLARKLRTSVGRLCDADVNDSVPLFIQAGS